MTQYGNPTNKILKMYQKKKKKKKKTRKVSILLKFHISLYYIQQKILP